MAPRFLRTFVLTCLILALPSYFALRYLQEKNAPYQIAESGSDVLYQGVVTEQSATKLLEALARLKAKRLFVNSYGGSSEGAMKVGDFILTNQIQVVVVGICYSACANYFFLPSKARAKTPASILGMHGGFQSYVKQRNALLAALPEPHKSRYAQSFPVEDEKVREEVRLLTLAGINPSIIVESAEKTYYGETTYIATKPEYFKANQPVVRKTIFELWFPRANDSDYPVPMAEFDQAALPTPFASVLRDYKGQGERAE
jgi:hypothetical protein